MKTRRPTFCTESFFAWIMFRMPASVVDNALAASWTEYTSGSVFTTVDAPFIEKWASVGAGAWLLGLLRGTARRAGGYGAARSIPVLANRDESSPDLFLSRAQAHGITSLSRSRWM